MLLVYVLFSLVWLVLSNEAVSRFSSDVSKIITLKDKNKVLKQEMDSLRMKLDFNDHANRRLEGYANTDELTRVYNRRKGLELIREQIDHNIS